MSDEPRSQLNEDEIEEIREIFSHFDTNNNGVIDRSEFGVLLEALDPDFSPDELAAGLAALDDNENGVIEFDEFLAWWGERYVVR